MYGSRKIITLLTYYTNSVLCQNVQLCFLSPYWTPTELIGILYACGHGVKVTWPANLTPIGSACPEGAHKRVGSKCIKSNV